MSTVTVSVARKTAPGLEHPVVGAPSTTTVTLRFDKQATFSQGTTGFLCEKGSFVNRCSRSQNIISPSQCGKQAPRYDEGLAKFLAFVSAAAYSNNPQTCVNNLNYLHETDYQTFYQTGSVTCDFLGSTCFAFAAYSRTKNTILLAYRGTTEGTQLVAEALRTVFTFDALFLGQEVGVYWHNAYYALYEVIAAVQEKRTQFPTARILVTGHSLGGALASMASTELGSGATLYTFGQPRVGSYHYALLHDQVVPDSWRVVNYADVVVHLPGCGKIRSGLVMCNTDSYYHHGTEVFYQEGTPTGQYQVCRGLPHNEDVHCSWNMFSHGTSVVKDHKTYFGINFGLYGEAGCPISHQSKLGKVTNQNSKLTLVGIGACCLAMVVATSLFLHKKRAYTRMSEEAHSTD